MDLKEIGINKRNWVDSTQDRDGALVNVAWNHGSSGIYYENELKREEGEIL